MGQRQRVLVSAGASGIGVAIAARFRADGAEASICDVDETAVAKAGDDGLHVVTGNIADPEVAERWVNEVVRLWGGIDVLVNNAGIAGPRPRSRRSPSMPGASASRSTWTATSSWRASSYPT